MKIEIILFKFSSLTEIGCRIPNEGVAHCLYMYFLDLFFRNASKDIPCRIIKIIALQYGNGYRNTNREKLGKKRRKNSGFNR